MKAIVAHHEISASGSPLESNQAERIADAANKTLGTLVGTLLGTYVTSGDQDEVAEPDAPDNIISFKMKMSLRMSAEDFDTTQNDLKELVLLRNNLVHPLSTSTTFGVWTDAVVRKSPWWRPTVASINTLSNCEAGRSTWIRPVVWRRSLPSPMPSAIW